MESVFNVRDARRIPAVTHVDGTARVQTVVNEPFQKNYYDLLKAVEGHTGIPIVLNTSFNINGQPIVNNPHEAIYTFYSSGLDVLYVGNYRLTK
jgi:carbamoyltransferase